MKKILKVLALIFMLFSTFGSALEAYAVPADRPDSGDLIIHKYLGDKTDQTNDGTEVTIPSDRELLSGVKFDVYEIEDPDDDVTPYPPPGNLGADDADKWTYTRNSQTLTVTGQGAHAGKEYTYTLGTAVSQLTTNGITTFADLSGYYYVEEDVAGSNPTKPDLANPSNTVPVVIANGMDLFIVAVPMWNQAGDGWLEDVHVYPKNQNLEPEKAPEIPFVEIGEEFDWFITLKLPGNFTSTNFSKFEIWDQLDYRLDYISLVVEGGIRDTSNIWTEKVTLTPVDDYTITTMTATPTVGSKVTVALTGAGIDKLGGTLDASHIRIKLKTKSNQYVEASQVTENDIPNKATVEFTNKDGNGIEEIPEVEVKYGTIAVIKHDEKGNTLTGSEFQLADTEANATAGNYLRVSMTAENGIADILRPGDTGYDSALPWIIRPHATTDLGLSDGKYYSRFFRGLKIGQVDVTDPSVMIYNSYWLVETKAPANFNMLDKPIKIVYDEETTDYYYAQVVINKRGFTLPETGSMVAIILTVLGIIFIGFSIIMSINKRKKA